MSEKIIGYAYTADAAGSMDEQLERLRGAGCTDIFTDSGKSGGLIRRHGFRAAVNALNAGDTLVVCAVNKLSRNHNDLLKAVEQLLYKGVELVALDNSEHAVALRHSVNYAPRPTQRKSPFRYAALRLGEMLVRYSMRASHTN